MNGEHTLGPYSWDGWVKESRPLYGVLRTTVADSQAFGHVETPRLPASI